MNVRVKQFIISSNKPRTLYLEAGKLWTRQSILFCSFVCFTGHQGFMGKFSKGQNFKMDFKKSCFNVSVCYLTLSLSFSLLGSVSFSGTFLWMGNSYLHLDRLLFSLKHIIFPLITVSQLPDFIKTNGITHLFPPRYGYGVNKMLLSRRG